ncbi:MAG: ACP phosphodiesterase [Pseudomonadota bacterium]
MNYLAHLCLGGEDPLQRLGNLAGDFVKGRLDGGYHPKIISGIRRHRAIDSFTDKHPKVTAAKGYFSVERRRVAGILLDLSFDHFLSRHWTRFHQMPLCEFIQGVYDDLHTHNHLLPDRLQVVSKKIIEHDWLTSYGDVTRLGLTIDRVAKRLTRPELLKGAAGEIERHYESIEGDFLAFFPELKDFAENLD